MSGSFYAHDRDPFYGPVSDNREMYEDGRRPLTIMSERTIELNGIKVSESQLRDALKRIEEPPMPMLRHGTISRLGSGSKNTYLHFMVDGKLRYFAIHKDGTIGVTQGEVRNLNGLPGEEVFSSPVTIKSVI